MIIIYPLHIAYGENDNYTNMLKNYTITHITPMLQEILHKWIQRRPQTTSFGQVDDDPKNNI
jgi:hypothetical protein